MTIKINVGVNKKVGLPDYGSAGSHCNIEIEADNGILDNPQQLSQRVKDAYAIARQAVNDELTHHRPQSNGQSTKEPEPRQESTSTGQQYTASAKQLDFVWSLAKAVKLDKRKLDKYADQKFGRSVNQLTPKEASQLIDDLKAAKAGTKEIAV